MYNYDAMKQNKIEIGAYPVLLTIAVFVIATFYPVIRIFPEINSFSLALLRFFWAVVILGAIILFSGNSFAVKKRDFLPMVGIGFVGQGLAILCIILGARMAGSSVTAILANTSPFIALMIGLALQRDVFLPRRFMGIVLAFIGVTVVILANANGSVGFTGQTIWGYLAGLGAATGLAIYGVFIGPYSREYGPVKTTFYAFVSSFVLMSLIVLIVDPGLFAPFFTWKGLLVGMYVGFAVTAFTRVIITGALRVMKASVVYIFELLIPVFVGIFDMVIFQDTLTLPFILGACVVLVGVYLTKSTVGVPVQQPRKD